MSDAVVIATLKSLGYKELVHYPSLLQHVGLEGTLGNSFGQVSSFLGEDYDFLTLPAPTPTAPRKSNRCQFERGSDFMVCQICGWRMRIHDSSLPPDRYRSRCGGADSRAQDERNAVPVPLGRSSPAKRRKRQPFRLGTFIAHCLKTIGVKQKTGCGCGRREEALNRWGRRLLRVFRRR